MPKVSWVMCKGFVANFIAFQQCKNSENRLRFDKVTKSLKFRVENFFETQCSYTTKSKNNKVKIRGNRLAAAAAL